MTLPFRRRSRPRGRARLAITGDIPDSSLAETQLIERARPAGWDGTTITAAEPAWNGSTYVFGGASGAGLNPGSVYPLPAPVAEPPVMPRGRPGTPDERRPRTAFGLTRGQLDQMAAGGILAQAEVDAALPAPAARPPGCDKIARDMAHGWPHLSEVRCAYPAAASATPIPCGTVHRDDTADSFPALRASARAAGWHPDALGRWACPRCCQASGEYRTLYPVTIRAEGAAGVRGEMWDFHAAYGGQPVLTPDGQILTVAAEHVLTARAEHDLRERTLRHYDNSHKRGVHADGAR